MKNKNYNIETKFGSMNFVNYEDALKFWESMQNGPQITRPKSIYEAVEFALYKNMGRDIVAYAMYKEDKARVARKAEYDADIARQNEQWEFNRASHINPFDYFDR